VDRGRALSLRDVVVLVPFVQLVTPARRAFAVAGGWMRASRHVDARGIARPAAAARLGRARLGMAHDTLLAMQHVGAQPWADDWSRRDPRGFAQCAARAVATAHQLMTAAAAIAPSARGEWWVGARELLQAQGGPAARRSCWRRSRSRGPCARRRARPTACSRSSPPGG